MQTGMQPMKETSTCLWPWPPPGGARQKVEVARRRSYAPTRVRTTNPLRFQWW